AFSTLDALGARLDATRQAYLSAHGVGLTTTYNRLKDPGLTDADLVAMRSLHEAIDRAVLDAYGWSDIPVPPYCGATPAQLEAFEDEVLDRLFDLNARRAHEEALLAKAAPQKKPARKKKGPA
ncbi:MAG: hypothetical protein INH37_05360, partial [Myxococcaceae bacterium]|nr:hypothetical protein [Myxococcaceae bacterium]